MKTLITIVFVCMGTALFAQENDYSDKRWGAEINVLWPIFPGGIYKAQATYEGWRRNELAGDFFAGIHVNPTSFREDEGYFGNVALTFGYRQFFWKGFHVELYQAFGPGWNRENVVTGLDYESWDYEVGILGGYRWEFFKKERRDQMRISPYISTQHGLFYVAGKSNPHPILNSSGERPVYVGTLNFGIKF